MKPYVFLNFKTYEQGTGNNALKLARIAQKADEEGEVKIVIIAQATDIRMLVENTKLPIFAQHADLEGYGANTGRTTLEALKQAGASGVMINHSEDRADIEQIRKLAKRCKQLQIPMLVCVASLDEAAAASMLKPEYMAYEDPKLIGSGKSVTEEEPDTVLKFAEKMKAKTIALCGAGVSTGLDLVKSLELGCHGVLLASAFVKSSDPEEMIMEFIGVK